LLCLLSFNIISRRRIGCLRHKGVRRYRHCTFGAGGSESKGQRLTRVWVSLNP